MGKKLRINGGITWKAQAQPWEDAVMCSFISAELPEGRYPTKHLLKNRYTFSLTQVTSSIPSPLVKIMIRDGYWKYQEALLPS